MAEETPNAGSAPADDTSLRDQLSAGLAKMGEESPPAETPAETPAEPGQEPPAEETAEQKAERERDEKGRFAKKEGAEAKSGEEKPEGEQVKPEGEEEGKTEKYAGPPPGWSVAAKAAFDDLPDDVKAAVAKREEEIDKGFADLRDYKALKQQLEPANQVAQQYGVETPELVQRFLNADRFLQQKPQEAIQWLCETYGIDPAKLAQGQAQEQPANGNGQGNGQQPRQPAQRSADDPLVREVMQLRNMVYGDKVAQTNSQVEQFFDDPKNRYAEDVAPQMVTLIKQANASGRPVDLNQIYETACYMNPDVRQALINEKLKTDQKAKADKARQTADQARQAGASIAGGPSETPPPASPESENLRALLEHNYASAAGRN